MYALTNCTIYTSDAVIIDRALWVKGDQIVAIAPLSDLPIDLPIVDLQGDAVAPGLIDMQLNGCGGVMFNDDISPETLDTMHQTNLKSGTTSFLPTLITSSDDSILAAIEVVKAYRQLYPNRVLGLHLEGPYLNLKRKGIHDQTYIRPPDRSILQRIVDAGPDVVKVITLAPEQVDSAMIQRLSDRGIIVSAGHTDATYEQAIAGFEAGMKMATHLFNAMSPWQGRSPGMVGAIFDRDEVYAGVIADGQHVHFSSIRLAKKIKQDKLILVTDATPPVGTTMTSFTIGGQQVFYQAGQCVSADGTLGGSATTMIESVSNCVRQVQVPLAEALRMASTYPAQLMQLADRLGRITTGAIANLVIFDRDFQITGMVDSGHYLALSPTRLESQIN